ncbi:MAG: hypothetical protein H6686_03370 [Fibrobacteria bacterium]|nr:hypothetical protein [Fibrobacteria bacterium]
MNHSMRVASIAALVALVSCQERADFPTASETSLQVSILGRLRASQELPSAQRVRLRLSSNGADSAWKDTSYISGMQLRLGEVAKGDSFAIDVRSYSLLAGDTSWKWFARMVGKADSGIGWQVAEGDAKPIAPGAAYLPDESFPGDTVKVPEGSWYTTDGSKPTAGSPRFPREGLVLEDGQILRIRPREVVPGTEDTLSGDLVSIDLRASNQRPASIPGNSATDSVLGSLDRIALVGSDFEVVWYRWEITPEDSTKYWTPILARSGSLTYWACNTFGCSDKETRVYRIDTTKPRAPSLSPSKAVYLSGDSLELLADSGLEIFVRTDLSMPFQPYDAPLAVDTMLQSLQAFTVRRGQDTSSLLDRAIQVARPKRPWFSGSDTTRDSVVVTIHSDPSDSLTLRVEEEWIPADSGRRMAVARGDTLHAQATRGDLRKANVFLLAPDPVHPPQRIPSDREIGPGDSIVLRAAEEGDAVFYKVDQEDWLPYLRPIHLAPGASYHVSTKAVYRGVASDIDTATIAVRVEPGLDTSTTCDGGCLPGDTLHLRGNSDSVLVVTGTESWRALSLPGFLVLKTSDTIRVRPLKGSDTGSVRSFALRVGILPKPTVVRVSTTSSHAILRISASRGAVRYILGDSEQIQDVPTETLEVPLDVSLRAFAVLRQAVSDTETYTVSAVPAPECDFPVDKPYDPGTWIHLRKASGSEESDILQYSVDGGEAWAEKDSVRLPEGTLTIIARVRRPGEVERYSSTSTWTFGTTVLVAPLSDTTVFLLRGDSLPWTIGKPATADDIYCRIDSSAWEACGASAARVSALAKGSHVLSVLAVRAHGKVLVDSSLHEIGLDVLELATPVFPLDSTARDARDNRLRLLATTTDQEELVVRVSRDGVGWVPATLSGDTLVLADAKGSAGSWHMEAWVTHGGSGLTSDTARAFLRLVDLSGSLTMTPHYPDSAVIAFAGFLDASDVCKDESGNALRMLSSTSGRRVVVLANQRVSCSRILGQAGLELVFDIAGIHQPPGLEEPSAKNGWIGTLVRSLQAPAGASLQVSFDGGTTWQTRGDFRLYATGSVWVRSFLPDLAGGKNASASRVVRHDLVRTDNESHRIAAGHRTAYALRADGKVLVLGDSTFRMGTLSLSVSLDPAVDTGGVALFADSGSVAVIKQRSPSTFETILAGAANKTMGTAFMSTLSKAWAEGIHEGHDLGTLAGVVRTSQGFILEGTVQGGTFREGTAFKVPIDAAVIGGSYGFFFRGKSFFRVSPEMKIDSILDNHPLLAVRLRAWGDQWVFREDGEGMGYLYQISQDALKGFTFSRMSSVVDRGDMGGGMVVSLADAKTFKFSTVPFASLEIKFEPWVSETGWSRVRMGTSCVIATDVRGGLRFGSFDGTILGEKAGIPSYLLAK